MMLALLAMLVFAGCSAATSTETTSQTTALKSAPEFTVQTTNGDTFSLADNKAEGKQTIVYFMASTCATCAKNWKAMD